MTEILIILALILANGVFAGSEIAVVALRRSRVQELAKAGGSRARAVVRLQDNPEHFLATVQVGITVVSATAAAFGGASIAARLGPFLAELGWFGRQADAVALGLVVAGVSYLTIVLGELVPKSLALRSAESYALLVGRPLLGLSFLARPLVALLTASANLVLKPFGDRTNFTETRHSADELQQLVEGAAKAGTIHPHAGEIASRALDLPDLVASDVMVPRQEVVMLDRAASPAELARLLRSQVHSRLPVYERSVDNVVGYIAVKDLLPRALHGEAVSLENVMRSAFFVPETRRAVELLQDMRRRRQPFAVVVDEQGGTSGIVTLEDLLEELVGEIFDEQAREDATLILREPDGSVVVNGSLPIREVNRALSIELPEDGHWTTLAGLCLELAGKVPRTGDVLSLEDGVRLEIVEASVRRVGRVRVRVPPRDGEQQTGV